MIDVRRDRRFLCQQQIDSSDRSLQTLGPAERHSSRLAYGSNGIGAQIVDGIRHDGSPAGQPRPPGSVPSLIRKLTRWRLLLPVAGQHLLAALADLGAV